MVWKTPPVPICMSLESPASVITPEQVIYRRNKLYARRRKRQWRDNIAVNISWVCGMSGTIFHMVLRLLWRVLHLWRNTFGCWGGLHLFYLSSSKRCIVDLSTFWCSTVSVWFPKWYPDPTKEVGTGCRGRDQQAMRWFGKGDSLKKYGHFWYQFVRFLGGILL